MPYSIITTKIIVYGKEKISTSKIVFYPASEMGRRDWRDQDLQGKIWSVSCLVFGQFVRAMCGAHVFAP